MSGRGGRAAGARTGRRSRYAAGWKVRGMEDEPYSVYRIAVLLPASAVGRMLSVAHPELRIEIQNRMEVPRGRVLFEARVEGPHAADWKDEVAGHPDVVATEVHPTGPESAIYRVTVRTPKIHSVVRDRRLLVRYPILIERGWMRFETVATASQVRSALTAIRRRVGPTRVEAVRRGSIALGTLGLTSVQEEIFRTAVSSGFFDAPRGISLTLLAERLGKSKSAVSEAIRKIQRRLADSALEMGLVPPRAES